MSLAQIRIPARLAAFAEVRHLVGTFAALAGLPAHEAGRLELVLEELFVNSVRHGHGGECDSLIGASLRRDADSIFLRYEDDAPPFDPLSAATPEFGADPDARGVGGLGIHIARTWALRVEYRREGGLNVVELVFRLPG
jgi:anti-sigma regulatory factor (Ser/Thr protein kinase)